MLRNVWRNTGLFDEERESEFATVLFAIIIGWILVSLWTRFIENAAFGTLGFNENSAWHSFLVALSVTIIFLALIWVLDKYRVVSEGDSDIIGEDTNITMEEGLSGLGLIENTEMQNTNPLALF